MQAIGAAIAKRPFMAACFFAGTVRSAVRSGEVDIVVYGVLREAKAEPVRRRPLLSERALMTVCGGAAFMYLWPILIWSDAKKLEVAARGLDPDLYETKTKTILGAILY